MEPLNACVFPCFHAAFVCPPVIHSYRCAAPGLLSTGTSRGAWKLTGGCLDVVAQHLNRMWHHFVLFIDVHCRHRLFPHQNLANPELHNPLPTLIAPTALRQYQWTRASDHFLRNLREKRQQRRPHRGVWWSGWRIQGFCMITLVVPRDQRLVFFGDQASRVQL